MFDFSNVKEVRLSRGAHKVPEQGMCFMEMAAWFAGEPHSDKPECVSPSLGALGIALNDDMPDRLRDEMLKPMIPHVVGTADEKAEPKRAEYICLRAFNYAAGLIVPEFARRTGGARSFDEARHMFRDLIERARYEGRQRDKAAHSYSVLYALEARADGARLMDALGRMFRYSLPMPSFAVADEPMSVNMAFDYPNVENARMAAAAFAVVAQTIPDWSAALDTLRGAIKLGRCDGFEHSTNLDLRHVELRELVEA